LIYLDHSATTPIAPEVLEAMMPYLTTEWGNPSSTYRFGSRLKAVLNTAREQVADLIGAHPLAIVFTSCATESNNTALHAALSASPGKRHIVTSAVEHSSVLSHCRHLATEGYRVTYLPVDRDGLLALADLENAVSAETAIVSLMWANNETGVPFPIAEIAALCQARGVLCHCDAVQAVGKLAVDVRAVPVDYLALSGHKIQAPKGIGVLYARRKTPMSPYLFGGHQERGWRGGTENVAFIAGLGQAAELARKRLPQYEKRVRPLRDRLETGILESIRDTERNGHATERLPNTSSITFHGIDAEALLLLPDQADVCASSGSACLADSDEPSHVVKAMKPDTGASRQTLRFSLGVETNSADIQAALRAVAAAVAALRGGGGA
jgi:cysteine desulfurase